MSPFRFLLPLLLSALAIIPVSAQESALTSVATATSDSQGSATPQDPSAAGGSDPTGRVQFTTGAVLVKYVAGTLPTASSARKGILGKLGCLVATESGLGFVKYRNQSHGRRFVGFMFHLADPSLMKGAGQCAKAGISLPIEWEKMQVLARGQVQNMSSASGSDFQLVSGIGSLAGAAAIETPAGYIGLGAVAGTSFAFYLNRRTQNYIAVFVRKKPDEEPKPITGSASVEPNVKDGKTVFPGKFSVTLPKADDPDDHFCKCDFAVFQVIDPHDYWNTSILLNAKTGQTFVSESAEKGGGSSSK